MEFSPTPETCRSCLNNAPQSSKLLDDIFTNSGPAYNGVKEELLSYLDVYKFVVEIIADDPLDSPPSKLFPTRICSDCEAQLTIAYEFRRKAIRSENELKNLLCGEGCQQMTVEPAVEEFIIKEELEDYEISGEPAIDSSEHLLDKTHEQGESSSNIKPEKPSNKKNPTSEQLKYGEQKPKKRRKKKQKDSKPKPLESQCEDCGKVVLTKSLAKHRKTHQTTQPTGERERPFACDLCDKRFMQKDCVTRHRRIHTNEKIFECPYCNEKFLHWASRRYHVQTQHTGEMKFTCEVCGVSFRNSSQYNIHIKRHMGEQPFGCEKCDRRFVDSNGLKRHQLVHTDEKNFLCDVCHKSYKSLKNLRFHKRTLHDLEWNYVCPHCGRAFTQNHVLRTHLVKHHPEYELPPPGTVVSVRAIARMREQAELRPTDEAPLG